MDFNIQSLMNYGALGICLGYFIYKDNKTAKDMNNTLNELKEVVTVIKEIVFKKGS